MRPDMSECIVTYVHEHVKVETKKKKNENVRFTTRNLYPSTISSVVAVSTAFSCFNRYSIHVCMYQSLMGKFIFNALCIWDCFVSSHHHRRRHRHFWEVILVSRYCELLLMCSVSAMMVFCSILKRIVAYHLFRRQNHRNSGIEWCEIFTWSKSAMSRLQRCTVLQPSTLTGMIHTVLLHWRSFICVFVGYFFPQLLYFI